MKVCLNENQIRALISEALRKAYEILGVAQNATPEEIKKAYRVKSVQLHPDRNPGKDTSVDMMKLNVAYGLLSDPVKRSKYDQSGDRTLGDISPVNPFAAPPKPQPKPAPPPAAKPKSEQTAGASADELAKKALLHKLTFKKKDKLGTVGGEVREIWADAKANHTYMLIKHTDAGPQILRFGTLVACMTEATSTILNWRMDGFELFSVTEKPKPEQQQSEQPAQQTEPHRERTFVKDSIIVKLWFSKDGKTTFYSDSRSSGGPRKIPFTTAVAAEQYVNDYIKDVLLPTGFTEQAQPAEKQGTQAPRGGSNKETYKVYGKRGDAPVHTRVKAKVYVGGKETKFKNGQQANAVVGPDGELKVTDPSTGHSQSWRAE